MAAVKNMAGNFWGINNLRNHEGGSLPPASSPPLAVFRHPPCGGCRPRNAPAYMRPVPVQAVLFPLGRH
jgi:hypothetical protein